VFCTKVIEEMYNKIKEFIKSKLNPTVWENLKLFILPCIFGLKTAANFLLYVLFWLLPIGFIDSVFRRKKIVLFYDLRVSTYRFDAVIAILGAMINVNAGKREKFDLVIYDPKRRRRQDGPLDKNATDGVRLHYLISVIFESLNVTMSLDEIYYIRSPYSLFSFWLGTKFSQLLPAFYTPFLPKTAHLIDRPLKILKRNPEVLPRFVQTPVFESKVQQYLESIHVHGPYLTLNLREKSWEKPQFNLGKDELQAMIALALKLKKNGSVQHILVIKDFEQPFETDTDFDLTSNGFIIVPEASLSVRFRVSLCAQAIVYVCGTNRTAQFDLFNAPPCLFLNKDYRFYEGDKSLGDFHALYKNVIIVNCLKDLQSPHTFDKLQNMVLNFTK